MGNLKVCVETGILIWIIPQCDRITLWSINLMEYTNVPRHGRFHREISRSGISWLTPESKIGKDQARGKQGLPPYYDMIFMM